MFYKGAPGQIIEVVEPGLPKRWIEFDADGFYESDSMSDHAVLTGHPAGVFPDRMNAAHGTAACVEAPSEFARTMHRLAHEEACEQCEDAEHSAGAHCCGSAMVGEQTRLAQKAAVDVLAGGPLPIGGGAGWFQRLTDRIEMVAADVRRGRRPFQELLELCTPHNRVDVSVVRDGCLVVSAESPNLRTTNGTDRQCQAMGESSGAKGASTATGATSLTDSGAAWSTDQWKGHVVATGQVYGIVSSNTATVLTISQWYDPASPGSAAPSTPATGNYVIAPGNMPAAWIAVTTDSASPAAGDTTLASEIATGGLARALATFSHTLGASTYQQQKQYSVSATFTGVKKAGMFNHVAAGTMWFESTFTSVDLLSGDTLTCTWTVTP